MTLAQWPSQVKKESDWKSEVVAQVYIYLLILRSNVPRVIQFLSYELNVFKNKNEFSYLCLTLSDYLCEKRLNLAGSFQKIKRRTLTRPNSIHWILNYNMFDSTFVCNVQSAHS